MKVRCTKQMFFSALLTGVVICTGCSSGYSVVLVEGSRVAMTEVYDRRVDEDAVQILKVYKDSVDAVMTPIIGYATEKLRAYRPESPLSNLIADVLREGAELKTGIRPEIGVMNMGGIRNILNAGAITFGSIYEISPFQNALVIVDLKGESLKKLFEQMAAVHGEGLSGANLVISKDGELLSAKVNGKEIDLQKEYKVATIDYLAEGNDHLEAFKEATNKTVPSDAILRDLFIDYVKRCGKQGKPVYAKIEGRIVEQQ